MLSTVTRIPGSAKPGEVPATDSPSGIPHAIKALAVVLREEYDVPFRFYSATGNLIDVPGQDDASASNSPRERDAALELAMADRPKVILLPGIRYLIGFPLADLGAGNLSAIGIVSGLARTQAESVQERASREMEPIDP
jgi:hypothetical protein